MAGQTQVFRKDGEAESNMASALASCAAVKNLVGSFTKE